MGIIDLVSFQMPLESTIPTGRNIRLFLPDGTADGIFAASMGNWVGQVLGAPRAKVGELLRRPECARTGIYLMLGPDPDRPAGTMAYIGEGDSVAARMQYHVSSGDQDFFDRIVVVVSLDDNLTKAHARYLESQLIQAVRAAGSVRLTNTRGPDFRRLPEGDRLDMDYFLAQLRIVLPLLEHALFRPAPGASVPTKEETTLSDRPVFVFEPFGAAARAIENSQGFVVLAGSTARMRETSTFPTGYRTLRDSLVAEGALSVEADRFRFDRDVVFGSPSAAAAIVAGRSASGPGEWRVDITGLSYREWKAGDLLIR